MSKRVDGESSNSKRTIPEILRSVSRKFRDMIHTQEQDKSTPPEMRTKKAEQFKKK
ncbi:MAG: hypothetical protein KDK61_01935 [Simkania sp.]|uniref:Uncharacterized protein n=1 Tax=Simkania negevensis (strain ATCC VR-1471 / DSM 27360 / Z) TaxID=331113 RepID=F8L9P2_SIMNZ|nr:hypothetical protein [Simkania negevensis]MCB1066789.1 hypothetical protein [Simkania sp.]MCP5490789.1 hypothetical protein [Chlamydiales bacterium]MCB1073995.1 hypothetical protein [Simkania sp.]MCB1083043.1 hypothetical protein [Simkania sp.]CCB89579.1 unknown protein [Simkania negevensis Z]